MRETEELKALISKLFMTQLFAILSTQGKDGPHSVIVSYFVSSGLRELVFVTTRNTRKYNEYASVPCGFPFC